MTEKEYQNRLADTQFVVEATSSEQFFLWKEWHDTVTIEQVNPGTSVIIGEFGDMPINLVLTWWRVNGVLIMFCEMVSAVTHIFMLRKWLDEHCSPRWDNGRRLARTDAMNFHHVLDHIRERTGRR